MKFTGDPQTINTDQETVFKFLNDFNNFNYNAQKQCF